MAGEVTPHAAFPLRVRAGQFVTVEQGSPEHLEQQAEIVLRTRPGTLEHDPDFGLRNLLATVGPAAPEVRAALARSVDARFLTAEDQSRLDERVRSVAVKLDEEA